MRSGITIQVFPILIGMKTKMKKMNKIWNNFTYFFRRKYRQISRVIDFLPLIWKGFDFDYRYSIDLFKHQLKRTADHLESDKAMSMSAGDNAKRIRTAVELLEKVYDDEYGMEYMDTIEKLYGKTHYDFVNLGEVSKRTGEELYELKLRNENAVDEQHQKEIDEVRKQMMLHSIDKQEKAEELVWKFISHNIRRWWD